MSHSARSTNRQYATTLKGPSPIETKDGILLLKGLAAQDGIELTFFRQITMYGVSRLDGFETKDGVNMNLPGAGAREVTL